MAAVAIVAWCNRSLVPTSWMSWMPFVRVVFSCSDVIPAWMEGVDSNSDLVKSHCEDG
jgi:hypothetical protein